MTNVAVILAGGVGNRLGLNYPKQFAKVAGKQIIEHTIEVFQAHARIDDIIVVSKAEYTEKVLELANRNHYTKIRKVINGGISRSDSTLAAITAMDQYSDDARILFHDAVRPFISVSVIDRCLDALEIAGAVDVVIGSADTLVEVDEQGFIKSIPKRDNMRRGQTPQAFRLGVIRRAYDIFTRRGDLQATCDCGVVLQTLPSERVATVEGDFANIKVTEPLDMFLADKLFQTRGDTSVIEAGRREIDRRMKDKVMVIIGGSYGIGYSMGEMARLYGAKVHAFSRGATGTDVSKSEDVARALERVSSLEGRIDYVVNSAAVLVRRPLVHMDQAEVESSIDVNLKGAFNVARLSYPYLAASAGGLLLFTSSSYTRGRAFYSVYSATKSAIVNLTQALAEEWQPDGIRVNCINPERTATPMRVKNFGHEAPHTLLTAEQVADASLAVLASGQTGQIVDVKIPEELKAKQIQKEIRQLIEEYVG